MRKTGWKIAAGIMVILLSGLPAFAQGLNGWFDISHSASREYEDGERTSERDTFNRNLYLNFHNSITQMLSYQINLRTNYSDADLTDTDGETSSSYRRSMEPAFDLNFGNPVYNMSAGYRIQEQWTTAHLDNDGRATTEFFYSRFNMSPQAFPTLNLQFDTQKNYDHLDDRTVDNNNMKYSVGSSYDLPSEDLKFRYNVNYSSITNRTPLDSTTSKTVTDNFNSNYSMGYADKIWGDRADYFVNYQGIYSRSKTEQFVFDTGTVLIKRLPIGGGLYIVDTTPDTGALSTEARLTDGQADAAQGINAINIGTGTDHNIGIGVSSVNSVDRLYIFVSGDVRTDTNLTAPSNWRLFKSNSNLPSTTWAEITSDIKSVNVIPDTLNNTYRYEIVFSTPHKASYFKAVNLLTVNVTGLPNVFVTEIEAYGTDFADEDTLTNVTTTFNQGLNLNVNIRALKKMTLTLQYSLDKADQNPVSIEKSLEGIIKSMFSDSIAGEKADFRSNVTRNYGASSAWMTHRLLTNTLRIQRSESFDNLEETNASSNTYNLSFNSTPLPALDASFSMIKNDSYNFDEISSTSNSLLLSIGTKLYRDVNSIIDFGYTRSKSFESEATNSSRHISGSIDAILTRKLSGNFNYGFNWTESEDASPDSKKGNAGLTYRPGRFININGNFGVSDSDGDLTTTEGILVDWLPVPAVRLNTGYQHSDSEPGPVKTDTFSGYAIYYVTKFADIRFTFSYAQHEQDTKTESYNFNSNINCRF
ncbi:MAG: hypothetical protein HY757_02840 [Nitrospirae bacterium]|nr:hypothetical protein [Nitrospirota bacterium]